ncbi:MAG: ABC-type sugar transport system substrate-binding protein [Paraglaciecola sp.]|jgi:ABC-type sugar transport system substrate-binding protein
MKWKWLFPLVFAWQANADNLQVTFVVPDGTGPLFWNLVADVGRSVADDLDVDIEVVHSASNRFDSKLAIEKILQRKTKPDYIIFRPFHGNAVNVFDLLESEKIPFVTLEQAFSGEEEKAIGLPQQKYKYWLGQINYDNKAGGELLTNALHKQHLKSMPKQTMNIIGIGGDFDAVSKSRQVYLEGLYKGKKDIVVNQIIPMYWSPITVEQSMAGLHQRYPNTNVYWCAGDQMALEVIRQLKLLIPNESKRILIGGFDWLPKALQKLKSGDMTASVGGHFLMAGAAVLKIVDYHNGINSFLNNPKPQLFELIDNENVDIYLPFLDKAPWPEIDFRQFSHSKRKQATALKLTVANLLQAYQKIPVKPKDH